MQTPMKETSPNTVSPVAAKVITTQADFIDSADLQLKEWSSQVDRLTADAVKLKAEERTAAEQQVNTLRAKLGAARQKLNSIRSVSSDKWLEAKAGLDTLWADVKGLFEKHAPKKQLL